MIAPETPCGKQQPPRDDVAVPGVDDDLHGLVQEVALDDRDVHGSALSGTTRIVES